MRPRENESIDRKQETIEKGKKPHIAELRQKHKPNQPGQRGDSEIARWRTVIPTQPPQPNTLEQEASHYQHVRKRSDNPYFNQQTQERIVVSLALQ